MSMPRQIYGDTTPSGVRTFVVSPDAGLRELRRRIAYDLCIYDTVVWQNGAVPCAIQRLPFHRYRFTQGDTSQRVRGADAAAALANVLALVDSTFPPGDPAATPAAPRRGRLGHGFRGVTKEGHRWRATVFLGWIGGRRGRRNEVYVGKFDTPEQAARAYDQYVVELGIDKPLNFPQAASS